MSVSTRVLDAAFALTCSRGWSKVTMADLAAEAGVSRQSVYNEFGNRQTVAQAMVSREVDRFLTEVEGQLARRTTDEQAAVNASLAVFRMADENPLLRAVLGADDASLLPFFSSDAVISVASQRVRAARPTLDDLSVDVIVRLVISHVTQPGASRPDMAEVARRMLR